MTWYLDDGELIDARARGDRQTDSLAKAVTKHIPPPLFQKLPRDATVLQSVVDCTVRLWHLGESEPTHRYGDKEGASLANQTVLLETEVIMTATKTYSLLF